MTHNSAFSDYAARLREFIRFSMAPKDGMAQNGSVEDGFNELARELFALQFKLNAPYRVFCQAQKITPEKIGHWAEIPAMPAVGFKELDLTSLPVEERARVFYSSGTTGQTRSRHFHDAESLSVYEASLLSWFGVNVLGEAVCVRVRAGDGCPAGEGNPPLPGPLLPPREEREKTMRFVMLTPSGAQAPHSSLVHMFETIAREFAPEDSSFTGYTESNGDWSLDLEKTASRLRTFGEGAKRSTRGACAPPENCPVMLMGTAFSFVHLLDFIAENEMPIKLPAGSRVLETGGYKGRSRVLPKAELHALITEWLGVPRSRIVCEYGMSELSSQAYDHPASSGERVFHFPPWARARIVSPETGREVGEGETGLIRIFDLANVRSVMAIQTEDLGVRRGDGFELIGRATQAAPRGCSLMSR
jgi:hypothetical protein